LLFSEYVLAKDKRETIRIKTKFLTRDSTLVIACSPNGKYVLTGGTDKKIKVWEIATGRMIKVFSGHKAEIRSISFLAGNNFFISSSTDGIYKVWDFVGERETHTIDKGFSLPVGPFSSSMKALSKDKILAARKNFLEVWELRSGKTLKTFKGHTAPITATALSHTENKVISTSDDETIKLWDLDTGNNIDTKRQSPSRTYHAVCIDNKGRYVFYGGGYNTIVVWDLQNGKTVVLQEGYKGHKEKITAVSVSPDGQFGLAGSNFGNLTLWSLKSEKLIKTFTRNTGPIAAVAFTPNGKYVLAGGAGYILKMWNVSTGKEFRDFVPNPISLEAVALSKDGRYILAGGKGPKFALWDLKVKSLKATTLNSPGIIENFSFSQNGRYFLTSGVRLRLWNLLDRSYIRDFKVKSVFVESAKFSPDDQLIASVGWTKSIELWKVATGERAGILEGHNHYVQSVAFSPDGDLVASGDWGGNIKIWNLTSETEQKNFNDGSHFVESLVFSPDGRKLLSGHSDGKLRLWNTVTGEVERVFLGHQSTVKALAVSSDNSRIISGGGDKKAILWSFITGKPLRTFSEHEGSVESVGFFPGGEKVLTMSKDEKIRIWSARSEGEMVELIAFENGEWVVFSSDGFYQASKEGHNHVNAVLDGKSLPLFKLETTNRNPEKVKIALGR
tara:strand:+ start:1301 stop:3316 length:2016 start_codon:yes stop_codon:yes gene_type:complete